MLDSVSRWFVAGLPFGVVGWLLGVGFGLIVSFLVVCGGLIWCVGLWIGGVCCGSWCCGFGVLVSG